MRAERRELEWRHLLAVRHGVCSREPRRMMRAGVLRHRARRQLEVLDRTAVHAEGLVTI